VINIKRTIVMGIITSFLAFQAGELAGPLLAKSPASSEEVKQKIAGLGVGALVEILYKGGASERGTIEAMSDESFMFLRSGADRANAIVYGDVESIKYSGKLSYKTSGQPDPAQVRRVVTASGVGAHVKVRRTDARRVSGDIVSIGPESFVFRSGANPEGTPIPYSDVQEIKGRFPAAYAAMVVAIPTGVTLALLAIGLSRDWRKSGYSVPEVIQLGQMICLLDAQGGAVG
jgi:hypothetical protein